MGSASHRELAPASAFPIRAQRSHAPPMQSLSAVVAHLLMAMSVETMSFGEPTAAQDADAQAAQSN